MKSVCIKNMACCQTGMKYNLHSYFRENGFAVINKIEEADYIIVISCAVIKYREDLGNNYIFNVAKRKKKKTAKIVIMGCLPKINKNRLSNKEDIIQLEKDNDLDRLFMSNIKLNDIESYHLYSDAYEDFDLAIYSNLFVNPNLWHDKFPTGKKLNDFWGYSYILMFKMFNKIIPHNNFKAFFILPNSGCSGICSYCAIKCAIGGVKSSPITNLKEQLNAGLAKGFKYFRLLSSNLADYGLDIKSNLLSLLNELTSLKQDYRFQVAYINPVWIVENLEEFLRILERKKIVAFSTPIQSGCQKILDLMNRRYDIKKVKKSLQIIGSRFPRLYIHTEIITGFPSETEDDLLETIELLKSVKFSDIGIFTYSERPNAPSAKIPCKVPDKIVNKRAEFLRRNFTDIKMGSWIKHGISSIRDDFGTGWKEC